MHNKIYYTIDYTYISLPRSHQRAATMVKKLAQVGWKTKLALRPIHRGEVHRLTSAKPRQMVINVKVNSVTNLYSNPLCAMQKETDPALRQRKVAIFGTDHV
nr:hypothetical protein Itr_chr13CG00450 [Ipomoea trifida]